MSISSLSTLSSWGSRGSFTDSDRYARRSNSKSKIQVRRSHSSSREPASKNKSMVLHSSERHEVSHGRARSPVQTDSQTLPSTFDSGYTSSSEESSVTPSSVTESFTVEGSRRRRRRRRSSRPSSDFSDLPPGSEHGSVHYGSPKICKHCHMSLAPFFAHVWLTYACLDVDRSPYEIHGRTDVLPALQLDPYSTFVAASRLIHLSGATDSPLSPNAPVAPRVLPTHLLSSLSPIEKRARRLALALDSDDPKLRDWAMEEYVKLGQAGRRLVREGVFEVRAGPPEIDSDDDEKEQQDGRDWAAAEYSAGRVDDVFREAAAILNQMLQSQDANEVGWREGEWGLDTPTAAQQFHPDVRGRDNDGFEGDRTPSNVKGKAKARPESPSMSSVPPSVQASPAPIHVPFPRTSSNPRSPSDPPTPSDGPSEALLKYSIEEAYPPEPGPEPERDLVPEPTSLPPRQSYYREPDRYIYQAPSGLSSPYDNEDIAVSSDIEGSDGGLTTPGASRVGSPAAPRGRYISSGFTTPTRSPSPPTTSTPLPVLSHTPFRLVGGAGSDFDIAETSTEHTEHPEAPSPARTPSPSLSADLTPGPPPPSPSPHVMQIPNSVPFIPAALSVPSGAADPPFPRNPQLPPIQFWLPGFPTYPSPHTQAHAPGNWSAQSPPPLFLALGARRACIPYTPAFQGLDLRLVRPVSARERLALRDAVAVLEGLGAWAAGEKEKGGDERKVKGEMWSLSYVGF